MSKRWKIDAIGEKNDHIHVCMYVCFCICGILAADLTGMLFSFY